MSLADFIDPSRKHALSWLVVHLDEWPRDQKTISELKVGNFRFVPASSPPSENHVYFSDGVHRGISEIEWKATKAGGLNHKPEQTGIWFDYNGWRYKDIYHVKLHDGQVLRSMRPNGSGWYPTERSGDVGPVDDIQVAQVMLVPDAELDSGFEITGEDRIRRNIRMFGDAVPKLDAPVSKEGMPWYAPAGIMRDKTSNEDTKSV